MRRHAGRSPDQEAWDADQVFLRAVVHRMVGISFSLQASLKVRKAGASGGREVVASKSEGPGMLKAVTGHTTRNWIKSISWIPIDNSGA